MIPRIHEFTVAGERFIFDSATGLGRRVNLGRERAQEATGSTDVTRSRDVAQQDAGAGGSGAHALESSLVDRHVIQLSLTNRCNLHCTYCWRQDLEGRRLCAGDMQPETIGHALEFLTEHFGPRAAPKGIVLALTGEPLLVPALIDDVVERCAALRGQDGGRVALSLVTNGILLTPEMVRWLDSRSINVGLSLDGPPHVNDAVRRWPDGPSAYQRVTNNVKGLLARRNLRDHRVAVSAVLTSSWPRPQEVFLHLYDLGFRSIVLMPLRARTASPGAITSGNVAELLQGYTDFARFLSELPDDDLLAYLPALLNPHDRWGRRILTLLHGGSLHYQCWAGRTFVSVGVDGRLYPCEGFSSIQEYCIGSIEAGIDERARAQLLRLSQWATFAECRQCWARLICGGPCLYRLHLESAATRGPDPTACQLMRRWVELGVFLLDSFTWRGRPFRDALARIFVPPSPPPVPSALRCLKRPTPAHAEAARRLLGNCPSLRLDSPSQVTGVKTWRGPDDLSASVCFVWNPEHLVLLASVQDDCLRTAAERPTFYEGDNLRFTLSVPEAGATEQRFVTRHFALAFVGRDQELINCDRDPVEAVPSARVQIERRGTETFYSLALPWTELGGYRPRLGDLLGLGLWLEDQDAGRARGKMEWGRGGSIVLAGEI